MNCYQYELTYFEDDGESSLRTGVTFANSLTDASANIQSFYGDENIDEISFEILYDTPIYELSNTKIEI